MTSVAEGPVRPPAVAGRFYPGGARELASWVDRFVSGAVPWRGTAAPPAIIAPHAGYIYSGPIAGSAFAPWTALRGVVRRIVLLGPAHYVPVRGLALPGASALATPLGAVEVDADLVRAVEDLPQVVVSPAAHAPEHALEVELPFLQRVLGEFTVLPLVVGDAQPEAVAEVLARTWTSDDTAVVVSSDLSHYLPYEEARSCDSRTSQQIHERRSPLHPRQACGALAINGLLVEARRRGLAADVVDLRNSGDTAGGRDQVVGYGAFAFHAVN